MVYKFFDTKTSGSGIKNENISSKELAEELHKPIIRKFKNRKVHSSFIDNIWDADLADMQLISTFNEGFRFLLCAIDIFSKYAWVVPLKDKKGITVTKAFQKILKESNRKPNKIWADKSSEFYNRSMKSFLQKNNIEMYSMYIEGKSVVAEIFIKILKNKIYKYMTSISKNVHIDKLDDIVNKYSIIALSVDVKPNIYTNSSKEIDDKDPEFKIGDNVRISKSKNILQKAMFQIGLKKLLLLQKLKILFHGHVISDIKGGEIVGTF